LITATPPTSFARPLLELLAIVVGRRVLDLLADRRDAAFDVGLLAGAVDDRRVVLVDDDALAPAEIGERDVLELDAELFGDGLAAGEDRDVLQHLLAAVAEARRLHPHTCSVPRILLTTSVASASPSTSSAMIRAACRTSRSARAPAAGPSSS
jgi:hypothetical protein